MSVNDVLFLKPGTNLIRPFTIVKYYFISTIFNVIIMHYSYTMMRQLIKLFRVNQENDTQSHFNVAWRMMFKPWVNLIK